MKKTLSFILCLCMLLPTLASCSENAPKETDAEVKETAGVTETSPVAEGEGNTADEEETAPVYKSNVPEGANYEGMSFTVVSFPESAGVWADCDWSATDLSGEVFNDAVFTRTGNVEELLNIDVKTEYCADANDTKMLANSVKSADNAYQLYSMAAKYVINNAGQGNIQSVTNFAKKGTLDLSSPWYDQNCIEDLSMLGHNFCFTGDMGTMYKKSIGIITFNKTLMDKHQLTSPYEYMKEDTWTWDVLIESAKAAVVDVDGDGIMEKDSDQFGLIYFFNMLATGLLGCDSPFYDKDENGYPIDVFYTERAVSAVEKMATLLYDTSSCWCWLRDGQLFPGNEELFSQDRGLYMYGEIHSIEQIREMESEFGIVPMPKYDEAQKEYVHAVNPDVAVTYTIPQTNMDFERCGVIIDALGAESKNLITPAYYETTLRGKLSRDVESTQSLDIILSTVTYDLGYLGGWGLADMLTSEMCGGMNSDLASRYQGKKKAIEVMFDRSFSGVEQKVAEIED